MGSIGAKLMCPSVPEYIMIDIPGLALAHGQERPKIHVSKLSAEQRDEVARMWREGLDNVTPERNNVR